MSTSQPAGPSSSSSSPVPYRVFISHAGEDKATIAMPLRKMLLTHGITAFVDEADMRVGTEAKPAMERAMGSAKIGLVILSPEFVVREWPMKELMCFLRRREEYTLENGREGREGIKIPMVIPFFYRLSVHELQHEPQLHRRGDDGVLLHEKSRFLERQNNGDVEADVGEIKMALAKLHGIMGVKNIDDANNGSSHDMYRKRDRYLEELCKEICRVDGIIMEMEASSDGEQSEWSDNTQAGQRVPVGNEEMGRVSDPNGEEEDVICNSERRESGDGVEKSPEEAVREYRRGVEDGDVHAMTSLARMLSIGAKSVPRRPEEAVSLYRRAAEKGDVDAICELAEMLECGAECVEQDVVEAVRQYRRVIELGSPHAMYNLAMILENGEEGVSADAKEAERLYRRAIETNGDIDSMYNLARLLIYGAEGVERNPREAKEQFKRVIEHEPEHGNALFNLAFLLERGDDGVERNAHRAVELYNRAADCEHSEAMFNLGKILENGADGVEQDPVGAKELYRRAIHRTGHVKAMFNLGRMLHYGVEGVESDAREAERLFREAIDEGHVDALHSLAVLLKTGAEGVARNDVEANSLLRQYSIAIAVRNEE